MATINQLVQAASFYTKKKRRQLSPLEQIMHVKQVKMLALQIGIDSSEKGKYEWFFDQITGMQLPQPYQRHYDQSKNQVYYLDRLDGKTLQRHPNLNLFRKLFYQFLQNEQGAATFQNKSKKLLPFIQEKLTRDNIGLNSKRRQFQKVNLKHDNGQAITSKLQRQPPDTDKLLQTRNYLLKNLIDKVVSKQQLIGNSKRAKAYLNILFKIRQQIYLQGQPTQTQGSIDQMQKLFNQAKQYYLTQYGSQLDDIPHQLVKSIKYLRVTPSMVTRALFLLGISKNDQHLYWLGKLYCSLPLPPNWQQSQNFQQPEYLYVPYDISFQVHPCILYVVSLINYHKHKFEQLLHSQKQKFISRKLDFVDALDRNYSVDLYNLLSKQQGNNNQESMIISDYVLLEGLSQRNNQVQDYYLLDQIYQFYNKKDFLQQSNFIPCVGPFGDVYWSSKITNSLSDSNPFYKVLNTLMNDNLKLVQESIYKQQFKKAENIPGFKNFFKILRDQKKQFLRSFMQDKEYKIKNNLQSYMGSKWNTKEKLFDAIFYNPLQLDDHIFLEFKENPQKLPPYTKYMKIKRVLPFVQMMTQKLKFSKPLLKQWWNYMKSQIPYIGLQQNIDTYEQIQQCLKNIQQQTVNNLFKVYVPEPQQQQQKVDDQIPKQQPQFFLSSDHQKSIISSSSSSQHQINLSEKKTTQQQPVIIKPSVQNKQPFSDALQQQIDHVINNIQKKSAKRNKFSLNKANRQQKFNNLKYITQKQQRIKAKRNFLIQNIKHYPKQVQKIKKPIVDTHNQLAYNKTKQKKTKPKQSVSEQVNLKFIEGKQFLSSIANSGLQGSIILPKTNSLLPGLLPQLQRLIMSRGNGEIQDIGISQISEHLTQQQNEKQKQKIQQISLINDLLQKSIKTVTNSKQQQQYDIKQANQYRPDQIANIFKNHNTDLSTQVSTSSTHSHHPSFKIIKHKKQLYLCPNVAQYWSVRKVVLFLGKQDQLSGNQIQQITKQWLTNQGVQVKEIQNSRMNKKISPFWINRYNELKQKIIAPNKQIVKKQNSLSKIEKPNIQTQPYKSNKFRCLSNSRIDSAYVRSDHFNYLTNQQQFNKIKKDQFKQKLFNDIFK